MSLLSKSDILLPFLGLAFSQFTVKTGYALRNLFKFPLLFIKEHTHEKYNQSATENPELNIEVKKGNQKWNFQCVTQ
ncbi:MAG: hypothetical protein LBG58_09480 [Planctomycetaceae bacterium]|nr:hypothetical protein [Planctomycetaceae bacterium]